MSVRDALVAVAVLWNCEDVRAKIVVHAAARVGGIHAAQVEARAVIAKNPSEDVHIVVEQGLHVSVLVPNPVLLKNPLII